ncbi:unnamed protein product, partial [Trichogramma brassicae]
MQLISLIQIQDFQHVTLWRIITLGFLKSNADKLGLARLYLELCGWCRVRKTRRPKKRVNYGSRSIELARGNSGYGFTISGQQPCILSCIVPDSPADLAGLRSGDYLIAVNGRGVRRAAHDDVVKLIARSNGILKLQIADNYYSDSSEDEESIAKIRAKPRYRSKSNHATSSSDFTVPSLPQCRVAKVVRDLQSGAMFGSTYPNNTKPSSSCSNLPHRWSMSSQLPLPPPPAVRRHDSEKIVHRAVLGYLGSLEIPSHLQSVSMVSLVKKCIKRVKAEQRNPSTVHRRLRVAMSTMSTMIVVIIIIIDVVVHTLEGPSPSSRNRRTSRRHQHQHHHARYSSGGEGSIVSCPAVPSGPRSQRQKQLATANVAGLVRSPRYTSTLSVGTLRTHDYPNSSSSKARNHHSANQWNSSSQVDILDRLSPKANRKDKIERQRSIGRSRFFEARSRAAKAASPSVSSISEGLLLAPTVSRANTIKWAYHEEKEGRGRDPGHRRSRTMSRLVRRQTREQQQPQSRHTLLSSHYPRFLRSDEYRKCLESGCDDEDNSVEDNDLLLSSSSSTKLKKSVSDAEDRCRKSILPWNRKNRSKSKDRGESEYNKTPNRGEKIYKSFSTIQRENDGNIEEDGASISSSRSSLASWDLALRQSFTKHAKSKSSNLSEKSGSECGNDDGNKTQTPLIAKWRNGVKLQLPSRFDGDVSSIPFVQLCLPPLLCTRLC